MTAQNVPDDWDCFYRRCESCGRQYHASEGGCDCEGSKDSEYWADIPAVEDLDREADEYFDRLERQREKGRP